MSLFTWIILHHKQPVLCILVRRAVFFNLVFLLLTRLLVISPLPFSFLFKWLLIYAYTFIQSYQTCNLTGKIARVYSKMYNRFNELSRIGVDRPFFFLIDVFVHNAS